jgi:ankyrin repeat protein
MIELLIRYGANIDIQDIWGNTPLLYAVDKEKIEAVETLLKHGAKVNLPDYRGNTPLHSACRLGNLNIVNLLLKNGADPEAYDYSNMKPVQRARKYEITEAIESEIHRRTHKEANAQQV